LLIRLNTPWTLITLWCLCITTSCEAPDPPRTAPTTSEAARKAAPDAPAPRPPGETKAPASPSAPPGRRIVAIGDLHGDLEATRAVLRLAGLLGPGDVPEWVGGSTILVQTGDVLDRGDGEQAILDLLDALAPKAEAAGGQIIELLGNHETMNALGDLRYVTRGGFADFEDVSDPKRLDPALAEIPAPARARFATFSPGGVYATKISEHLVTATVDGNVFAHAGVLPAHLDAGLDRLNASTRAWLRGEGEPPAAVADPQGPLWTRLYSQDPVSPEACAILGGVLSRLKAKRMVVGHTVQRQGITSACDGRIWRIDVGMSAHYGGSPAALEIVGDEVRILTAERVGAQK